MTAPAMRWSEWQSLASAWNPSAPVLAETLDGGQAFRWQQDEAGVWTGHWSDCVAQLRVQAAGVEWRSPEQIHERVARALPPYLALDQDWDALADALPWRSDPHLAGCQSAFPGLRLLRQPFGETLLGFLCSAAKQIVQIKRMLALLAERHGAPLIDVGRAGPPGAPSGHSRTARRSVPPLHCLPTWAELAEISEADLRACQFGFRARYVRETAQFLAGRPGWLDETECRPYAVAKTRLLELPGVGEKVADCVLLFGAGRLEAFPVDVWVLKSLARRYGLAGWKPAQVAQFGRTHFGPSAGLAQQYLFAWERRQGER